eukprot:366242-Chlamydomonas_euryale.AAC.14
MLTGGWLADHQPWDSRLASMLALWHDTLQQSQCCWCVRCGFTSYEYRVERCQENVDSFGVLVRALGGRPSGA